MGGTNNDKQQTVNRHSGSGGTSGINGSNGINGNNGNNNDKEQTEKRHSWRLEMFEDQKVVLFVKQKKPFTMYKVKICIHLGI